MNLKLNGNPVQLDAPGYETLADVLYRAFAQASEGKGKERHAGIGEQFEAQMMQDMAKRFGVGSLLGQAFKKSEESQRLPHDRAVAELLGAINYLAGAVIAMELWHHGKLAPANDNSLLGIHTHRGAMGQQTVPMPCRKHEGVSCRSDCPCNA